MFKYLMPTKIICGENAVMENKADLILGKRAMIVTGRSSGEKSGALADVKSVLENMKIEYSVYDCIGNNPTIEECVEGGKAARDFGCDFLIGIGGGSPLDACKAIAVFAQNEPNESGEFGMYDIFECKYKNKPLPMAAIPTTAGTGSEVTPYSILTLHNIKNKRSFASADVFYRAAFLDGRYTVNLPLQVARNTAVDAMCHLIEGFTDKKASPAGDYIALEGLRIIGKHKEYLINGGFDVKSCTELLWGATLGGIVISQSGTTVVHSMGYPLTYFKNIPHGMANGLLLIEYMKRTKEVLPEKIEACLNAFGMNMEELEKFLTAILPCDAEFNKSEIEEWSEVSIKAKNAAVCPFDITREDEVCMYRKSLLCRERG